MLFLICKIPFFFLIATSNRSDLYFVLTMLIVMGKKDKISNSISN